MYKIIACILTNPDTNKYDLIEISSPSGLDFRHDILENPKYNSVRTIGIVTIKTNIEYIDFKTINAVSSSDT